MAKVVLQNGRAVGDYECPYVIAEVNSSHNGNVETAKKMIVAAAEIGCDCVKFQSWSAESLYSKSFYGNNLIARRIVEKFSLSEDQLVEMSEYCTELGVSFSSTPYSRREVDSLITRCHVPYIKVASMDINNYGYLRYIAEKGVPIVLSTGMAEIEEIKKAVKVIEDTGNRQIILLHCISIYPAEPETIHLNNILGLREMFPDYPIGFSDHTLGTEMAAAATALGAAVIEKHLTLDKSKMGMDNNMATEPDEFALMIRGCKNVYKAMGRKERVVSEQELIQRKKMRRSIVSTRFIKAGEMLSAADMDAKRPGDGIPPQKIGELIGKKVNRDIEEDTQILQQDIV